MSLGNLACTQTDFLSQPIKLVHKYDNDLQTTRFSFLLPFQKKVRELLYLQGSQNNRVEAEGESEIPLRGEKSVEENS